MNIATLLNKKVTKLDKNGIWTTDINLSKETQISQKSWTKIYNQNLKQLLAEKKDFTTNKLEDHMKYVENSYKFSKKTIYLEIGCGPAYIGEFLMKQYDCYFIGVDFNYGMLLTLKRHFDNMGFKKYILIHSDILKMPLKNNSVDYIYGGGVIEHLKSTTDILKELFRVLKKEGVSFNTVPAFNLQWPTRFYRNIPNVFLLKQMLEFIHITIFKGTILDKNFGYELSYTITDLKQMHRAIGFKNIAAGPFVFHPSKSKLPSPFLRFCYIKLTSLTYFSPVYFIYGKK